MMESVKKKIRSDPSAILHVDTVVFSELQREAARLRELFFPPSITFYAPTFESAPYSIDSFKPSGIEFFRSISITGEACSLQCEHCKGHLLESMTGASPATLHGMMVEMIARGTRGFLISGGSDKAGVVPINEIIGTLKEIKEKYDDVEIVLHSGFLDEQVTNKLMTAGIDGVMFDFCGAASTLKKICHLDRKPVDYQQMIKRCKSGGIPVMPHVIVGLDAGEIRGEFDALRLLQDAVPDVLVFVILMPIPGTPLEHVEPPRIDIVERLFVAGRLLFPGIPVVLGCAKPSGMYKIAVERAAFESGFNAIAYPT
ncbi:MAG: hypothetical protein ACTSUE_08760, partial [Promethearchaeota archaeon]